VVREGDGSLVNKLQAVGLDEGSGRKRVFRLVASVTEEEAQTLLQNPDMLEEFRRTRQNVKQNALSIKKMAVRDRGLQRERLKASRLRVLNELRVDQSNSQVLDVDLGSAFNSAGKRPREDDEVEKQQPSSDPLMCNGTPMKRIELSLSAKDVMVDLFVEQLEGGLQFDDLGDEHEMYEMRLERFADDEDDPDFRGKCYEDEDPDGEEVDYPSGSSSDFDSENDRDEFNWSRPGYDSENEYEQYEYDDPDDVRHYDRSLYFDDEMNNDRGMPWNKYGNSNNDDENMY
jgi:hypothetical protein